jgi:hypothetical protein
VSERITDFSTDQGRRLSAKNLLKAIIRCINHLLQRVLRARAALTTFKTLKTDRTGFVTGSLIGPWLGELFAGALEAGRVGLLGSKRVADVIAVARRRSEADKARIIPVMNWQPTAPAA